MNTYPRETVEFVPVTVTVDGVAVTTGVRFAVVAYHTRPSAWTDAVPLEGKIGVMLSGLTPRDYRIFAKVDDSPETPVVDCGVIRVT